MGTSLRSSRLVSFELAGTAFIATARPWRGEHGSHPGRDPGPDNPAGVGPSAPTGPRRGASPGSTATGVPPCEHGWRVPQPDPRPGPPRRDGVAGRVFARRLAIG